jgi:hypothetical protein
VKTQRKLGRILTASALACGSLALSAPAAERPSAEFVSGGVGLEARQQMKSQEGEFNLHLEFATTPSGEYLADVEVTITDARGGNVLSTRAEGPWLFARLPAGSYTVAARAGDTVRRQQISVGAGRRHVVMRFPAIDEARLGSAEQARPPR